MGGSVVVLTRMAPIDSGGLVGGVCHCLLLLPMDEDVELSSPFTAPCLSVCHHDSYQDNNEPLKQ